MERSQSITRPRTRKQRRAPLDEQPVLQLPLPQPEWRDPVEREIEPTPKSDRGVAHIDFYI